MKKFKYPLIITGSEQELKSLVPKLVELGYNEPSSYYTPSRSLVTNQSGIDGLLEFISPGFTKGRTKVSASNPELVLALAAMVDDNEFYSEEMVICNKRYGDQFTEGKMYKVKMGGAMLYIYIDDLGNSYNGLLKENFRKATVEEIMDHFRQHKANKIENNLTEKFITSMPPKEPIAYEVVTEILTWKRGTRLYKTSTGQWHPDADEARVGSLCVGSDEIIRNTALFKPIYKEEPKVIKVLMHSEPDNFKLEVSKDGIYYRPENSWISINDIRCALTVEPTTILMSRDNGTSKVYDLKPSHFNCGCQRMVPREDIENVLKVYDELNRK